MKRLFILIVSLVFVGVIYAQTKPNVKISEQQEIAVFASYYTYDIPANIVNKLDDGIVNLFLTMKRFKVNGYQFRFSESNLEQFISRVKELQAQKITKSEKFVDPKWGTITLTPEMLEKIVNSYTIVIPNIKSFGVETTYDDGQPIYTVTMGVSLKFFDPAEGVVFHVIDVKKSVNSKSGMSYMIEAISGGKSKSLTREETILLAVDSLIEEIKYEIRKIEKFKLYTTIVEVSGGRYFIELGKNYDINPGLELDLVKTRTITIGGKTRTVSESLGLVRVVNSEEDFSEVIPIFGDLNLGDQLVDSLRRGFIFRLFLGLQQIDYNLPSDTSLLGYFQSKWNNLNDTMGLVIGVSGANDGSYAFFEPQIDLTLVLMSPITITIDLLFNYSLYLRNLKIKPFVGINLLGSFSYLGSIYWSLYYLDFYLTTFSLGVTGGLNIEYLFTKYIGLNINVGYKYTLPVYNFIRVYDSFGNEYQSSAFTSSMIPDFGLRGLGGSVALSIRY